MKIEKKMGARREAFDNKHNKHAKTHDEAYYHLACDVDTNKLE